MGGYNSTNKFLHVFLTSIKYKENSIKLRVYVPECFNILVLPKCQQFGFWFREIEFVLERLESWNNQSLNEKCRRVDNTLR